MNSRLAGPIVPPQPQAGRGGGITGPSGSDVAAARVRAALGAATLGFAAGMSTSVSESDATPESWREAAEFEFCAARAAESARPECPEWEWQDRRRTRWRISNRSRRGNSARHNGGRVGRRIDNDSRLGVALGTGSLCVHSAKDVLDPLLQLSERVGCWAGQNVLL